MVRCREIVSSGTIPAQADTKIRTVGADGAPLPILLEQPSTSRAKDIWDRIKHVNADPKRERKAVGRITIVHEPSPLLFAALHYTMSPHFDVDELFQLLVDTKTDAFPHRPFSLDKKHRKTFVWTMVGHSSCRFDFRGSGIDLRPR